jgi:nitrogen fixation/metabolism regulation signal transduction histidine kinase
MKSSSAELIVGSSQDIDDDLSDVEEVFIRDGRNGKSREIENKPLMPPRKKQNKNSKTQQQLKALKNQYKRSRSKRHRCCESFCYAILVLLVILILAAIVLTLFPTEKLKLLFQNASPRLYKALLVSNVATGDEQEAKPVELIEKVIYL